MSDQPTDITTLFHRDPVEMTDEDIEKIISVYRSKRSQFQANPARVAAKPKPKTPAAKAAAELNLDIKL